MAPLQPAHHAQLCERRHPAPLHPAPPLFGVCPELLLCSFGTRLTFMPACRSTAHHTHTSPLCAQVMREFGFLVRVCTAREATNFGIFLNEVFALVERWRVRRARAGEVAPSASGRQRIGLRASLHGHGRLVEQQKLRG